jgi:hypothetical protein
MPQDDSVCLPKWSDNTSIFQASSQFVDHELQAGKTTTKNRHTQETKGTNEHDKWNQKKEQQSP